MAIPSVGIQLEKRTLLRKLYEPTLKIYTDEIAIKVEAYTNRKCINGYSISLKNHFEKQK